MKRATKILSISLLVCLSIYTTVYLNLNRGSKVVNGIEISEVLLVHTKDRGIDYCEILSTATKGDEESIRELLLLEIYDAAGYDHGTVIVDLIKIVGEDKIILKPISEPISFDEDGEPDQWETIGYERCY